MAMRRKSDQMSPPPRTNTTTIATIAAHMGLSRATVTHVLNGRAEEQRIRPETRHRVLKAAQELGYRANASARAIRSGRYGNIALVQSLFGQYLPLELLLGLTTAISDKDLHLVLSQVPDIVIGDGSYLPHTMRELSVDGVLVYRHIGFSQAFLEQIQKMRVPAIYLNVQQEFDCVHPDDLMGGRIGTEFLLGLGHERIAYIDPEVIDVEHYSQPDRRAGYVQAMQSAGKTPRVHILPWHWEVPDQVGEDRRVESAKALLDRKDRPTAVVAYELAQGLAVVHAARILGLRIPQDLSLIQFHNCIDDRFFLPIHTISNVMTRVGKEAVEMLLEKINAPEILLPERAVPVELLEGATCMPPSCL